MILGGAPHIKLTAEYLNRDKNGNAISFWPPKEQRPVYDWPQHLASSFGVGNTYRAVKRIVNSFASDEPPLGPEDAKKGIGRFLGIHTGNPKSGHYELRKLKEDWLRRRGTAVQSGGMSEDNKPVYEWRSALEEGYLPKIEAMKPIIEAFIANDPKAYKRIMDGMDPYSQLSKTDEGKNPKSEFIKQLTPEQRRLIEREWQRVKKIRQADPFKEYTIPDIERTAKTHKEVKGTRRARQDYLDYWGMTAPPHVTQRKTRKKS